MIPPNPSKSSTGTNLQGNNESRQTLQNGQNDDTKSKKGNDTKIKKEDKKQKAEQERLKKEEDNRKKDEEKKKEKQRKADEKKQSEDEKKRKSEEEKKKKENEKRQNQEDKKKRQEDEKKQKEEDRKRQEEDEKKKKAEEKKQKNDDKKRKQEEEKHKKEEEKKKRQEDERKLKEDEKKSKQEEEKKKKEDEKHRKEEDKEKRQEDDKRKKEAERREKNYKDTKLENERKLKEEFDKAQEKGKRKCCRAGVCRCWYCCCAHTCLPPIFWVYGMALFGFSLFYALKYTLELDDKQQQLDLHLLYWATVGYASVFIMLVQLTYLLVLFESIRACCRCMFGFLFIATFLTCLAVLIFSIYCNEFCPNGKPVRNPILRNLRWRAKVPGQLFHLRFAAAITMGLMVFLLHIYLYNVLQFMEEFKLKNNKVEYCGGNVGTETTSNATVKSVTTTASSLTKYRMENEITNNNRYYYCGSSNYSDSFMAIAHRYRSIAIERSPRIDNYYYDQVPRSNYSSPVSAHSSYSYHSNKSFQC